MAGNATIGRRQIVITDLANTLDTRSGEVERLLHAVAKVLGPFAAEVPPYFEGQIQTLIRSVC